MEKYTISPFDSQSTFQVIYPEGDTSLERFNQLSILSQPVRSHRVLQGDTLSGISFHYYGDPGYWDRIAETNEIMNPLDDEELYEGLVLIIPDINNIRYY